MLGIDRQVLSQLLKRQILTQKYWYPHCYNVTLNIEFWYVMKNIASLNKMIGTVYDICRSVKKSPKRNTKRNSVNCPAEND